MTSEFYGAVDKLCELDALIRATTVEEREASADLETVVKRELPGEYLRCELARTNLASLREQRETCLMEVATLGPQITEMKPDPENKRNWVYVNTLATVRTYNLGTCTEAIVDAELKLPNGKIANKTAVTKIFKEACAKQAQTMYITLDVDEALGDKGRKVDLMKYLKKASSSSSASSGKKHGRGDEGEDADAEEAEGEEEKPVKKPKKEIKQEEN